MARSAGESQFTRITERNISALFKRRQVEEKNKSWQNKLADAITRFTGSMTSVAIHLVLFGLWILTNLGVFPGVPRFDPDFIVLAMFASVEAIFLSTFILITQNRMAEISDKRADLDLQISLTSEHEITRVIKLLTAIAEKMEIEEAKHPEIEDLKQDVPPEAILDKIEETKGKLIRGEQIHIRET